MDERERLKRLTNTSLPFLSPLPLASSPYMYSVPRPNDTDKVEGQNKDGDKRQR
jgi:hypothetical protein